MNLLSRLKKHCANLKKGVEHLRERLHKATQVILTKKQQLRQEHRRLEEKIARDNYILQQHVNFLAVLQAIKTHLAQIRQVNPSPREENTARKNLSRLVKKLARYSDGPRLKGNVNIIDIWTQKIGYGIKEKFHQRVEKMVTEIAAEDGVIKKQQPEAVARAAALAIDLQRLDQKYETLQKTLHQRLLAKETELKACQKLLEKEMQAQMPDTKAALTKETIPAPVFSQKVKTRGVATLPKNHKEDKREVAPRSAWKLFYVGLETPLPSDPVVAIEELDAALKRAKRFTVDAEGLYHKLVKMSELDPKIRERKLDKLAGEEYKGWYKLFFGPHRIALSFDDQHQILRFAPHEHEELYQKIWHKKK